MPDSLESERSTTFSDNRKLSCLLPCQSLCLCGAGLLPRMRRDDPRFGQYAGTYAEDAQRNAMERLVNLKQVLRTSDPDTFWTRLMEGVTSICGAQYGFVAKKVAVDETRSGTTQDQRSHLLGIAFYYNDGHDIVGMHRDSHFAGGNPLSHMDHEKPCLITKDLGLFIPPDLSNELPFAADGYLAVPLFSGRRCLAHLGLMWTEEGLRKRGLAWSSLEMILYTLEDLVVQRILDGADLANGKWRMQGVENTSRKNNNNNKTVDDSHSVVSHESSDFSTHPLKPYARSLSHELRTPMQGIVGMLDVMHATVREAMESKSSAKIGYVFQSLKESIEMVQDSARRAVEAADNVVHAYDLNMQVPKTPQHEIQNEILGGAMMPSSTSSCEDRPDIFIEGSNIPVNPYKRRRGSMVEWNIGSATKQRFLRMSSRRELSPRSEEVKNAVHESEKIMHATTPARQIEAVMANMVDPRPSLAVRRSAPHLLLEGITLHGPVLRFTKLRDLLRLVINESLHVGGRPDFAASETTEFGERIEVRSRSSNGTISSKIIDWSVDPALPDTLLIDDRDLAKLISCVFLNAIKFTNSGNITLCATTGPKNDSVLLITVRDTGPGIPEAFLPNLFKPFAREDTSTTRSKDGLGLGLLVAKGLARKMGGDLVCVRSSTSGPNRGSEFEIRLPVNQPDVSSSSNKPPTPAERILSPPHQLSDHSRSASASSFASSSYSIHLPPFQSPASSRSSQPVQQLSPCLTDETTSSQKSTPPRLPMARSKSSKVPINGDTHDSKLAEKYPLTFLVAEDNRINRRVLVNMLRKLGYHDVYEACDGKEAVRVMQDVLASHYSSSSTPSQAGDGGRSGEGLPCSQSKKLKPVDVVLMDLWMPEMDGYEATSRIFDLLAEYQGLLSPPPSPTVLAVSADVTDEALGRASKVGIKGYMTKPYKLSDLERLIVGFCGTEGPMGRPTTDAY